MSHLCPVFHATCLQGAKLASWLTQLPYMEKLGVQHLNSFIHNVSGRGWWHTPKFQMVGALQTLQQLHQSLSVHIHSVLTGGQSQHTEEHAPTCLSVERYIRTMSCHAVQALALMDGWQLDGCMDGSCVCHTNNAGAKLVILSLPVYGSSF